VAMLLGLWTAWMMYIRNPRFPATLAAQFSVIYDFLLHKWYFDELYHLIFVRPAFAIGRLFWHRGDEQTIDRFGPNGSAWLVQQGTRVTAKVQTGYLYSYAFVMLIGLTAAITWAISQ
jgi:NADH-quinone oxidoreductase subunit L